MTRRHHRVGQGRRRGPTPRTKRGLPEASQASSSGANTVGDRTYRRRPGWHRIVGCLLIAGGIALAVLNDLDYADLGLLPGGHNELYFVFGVAIAASGSWWLGLFDRRR